MRIYHTLTVDMNKPIGNGLFERISEDSFEYTGPVEAAKKGRPQTEEAANGANDIANSAKIESDKNRQLQLQYKGQSDPFGASLIPGANGALSPYASAQLDQDKRNIGKTYSDVAQTGLRGLAARGMGSAPTGMQSSIINTAGRNAGEAQTNAYENAQKNTLNQGLAGLQYSQGQQSLYDPTKLLSVGDQARGTAAQAGKLRNGMGSGLGDVGAGLGSLASFAMA